jgi:hypothetical protein
MHGRGRRPNDYDCAVSKRALNRFHPLAIIRITEIRAFQSACASYRLRDPVDLNANLRRFIKVKNGIAILERRSYNNVKAVCGMSAAIAVLPPSRLQVTELVTKSLGRNNVMPSLAMWFAMCLRAVVRTTGCRRVCLPSAGNAAELYRLPWRSAQTSSF